MTDHPGKTPAQRRVLDEMGCGGKTPRMSPQVRDALFVWRRFIDDSGQRGVNCAVFRNESKIRSSELVRQADAIADFAWPSARHYTFVDARKVRSSNPGFCFLAAGWRRCGMTKSGLNILERLACND